MPGQVVYSNLSFFLVPGALACLSLVLQSLCDLRSHLLLVSCRICLNGSFLSTDKGALRYLLESGFISLYQCGEWFSLPA
jgi:hypothetical protein